MAEAEKARLAGEAQNEIFVIGRQIGHNMFTSAG